MGLKSRAAVGALALALGVVTYWEGFEREVYIDPVGIPTVCYGHVVPKSIKVGTKFSSEACHEILMSDLTIAANAVRDNVRVEIPEYTKAAMISFVYNAGIGNFKRSTMLKLLNEGKWVEACHELPKWVYAKGKKLKGLVNRRQAEMQLCLGNA